MPRSNGSFLISWTTAVPSGVIDACSDGAPDQVEASKSLLCDVLSLGQHFQHRLLPILLAITVLE